MYIVLSLHKNLDRKVEIHVSLEVSVSVNLCGSYQRGVIIGSKILEPLEKTLCI